MTNLKHIKTTSPFFIFILLILPSLSWAYDIYPQNVRERSTQHKVYSHHLEEEREIYVRLPLRFDPDKKYPVIYVPDGEYNFEYVAAYIDQMTNLYSFPQMIVTGVKNVNRNRDFVPKPDSRFPYTGEANIFYNFVSEEWIGFIKNNFNANDKRILIGHSFGGVFTFHSLFKDPNQFSAYIALGSSTWVSDRVLFEEAETFFNTQQNPKAFVYSSVGENDGGATVPDGNLFAEVFQEKAPSTLEWYYEVIPETDHFTNFIQGVHKGLHKFFPSWGFDKDLRAIGQKEGVAGIKKWFKDKKDTLGFRFQPRNFDLGVAALLLAQSDKLYPEARAVIEELKKYFPDHPRIYIFSGMIEEMSGNNSAAFNDYSQGKELTIEYGFHPNIVQLPSVEASIERVKK